MMRAMAIALASTANCVAPAMADEATGRWSFRTDIQQKGCTIEGTMTIEASDRGDGVRDCSFLSQETCPGRPDAPATMEQSCRVIQQGKFFLITSKVIQSFDDAYPVELYLPDHFTVKPDGKGKMIGQWYDANYRDSVVFWKGPAEPTS